MSSCCSTEWTHSAVLHPSRCVAWGPDAIACSEGPPCARVGLLLQAPRIRGEAVREVPRPGHWLLLLPLVRPLAAATVVSAWDVLPRLRGWRLCILIFLGGREHLCFTISCCLSGDVWPSESAFCLRNGLAQSDALLPLQVLPECHLQHPQQEDLQLLPVSLVSTSGSLSATDMNPERMRRESRRFC